MRLYKNFCTEEFDENGALKGFELKFNDNYNFGYDVLDVLGERTPDEMALVWRSTDGSEKFFTFRDLSRLSNKAANVFRQNGVKKGDRVLVILKRNYEYWYVAPALHKLGAVMIPATHMLTEDDISYRLQAADISFAVCMPDNKIPEKLLRAKRANPTLKTVFGVRQPDTDGIFDLTAAIDSASEVLERQETRAEEPMLMYFTSGTTGFPKAVMHDHTYTLAHIVTARYWQCVKDGGLHLTVAETGWGKASWGKIYGQWLCGSAVMVYDFDVFSPKELLHIIEHYGVTTFCAPPTIYKYFVKFGMDKYDLSALTHLTTAGEAINPQVTSAVLEQTGLKIYEGFGQTESVLMLANFEHDELSAGSMGRPSPLYDIRIQRPDGSFAGANEEGEIIVVPKDKQYGIFAGYYGNEELYKSVWEGGVYHTGDIGYFDDNGCYFYVSRRDDVIKSRGFRIGPFEIENKLMEHPAVLDCAVIGIPDKERGQAVKAFVILNEGYESVRTTANKIKADVNTLLADYKRIHDIELVSELPKTISGKIRRTELRRGHEKLPQPQIS